MQVGDRIRIQTHFMGNPAHIQDYTIEKFRHCLGIFMTENHRTAGHFVPLCKLYEPGPESEFKHIPNYGDYYTNAVQVWADIPKID